VADLNNITFACENPVPLSEFWTAALGYEPIEPRPAPTESIPIHLDLKSEDRHAEVERLKGLGATEVEERSQKIGPYEEFWTVMRDPEGNGFCVS
jgi:hypothetical protein